MFDITDGPLSVRVGTRGGALYGASFEGVAFLIPGGGPDSTMANFPLVPFGNRVEHNSFVHDGREHLFKPNSGNPLYLHGDGWLENWQVDTADASSITLSLRHRRDDVSPYDYTARQMISVAGERLSLQLAVLNEGETSLPFGLGQHPFFVRTPLTRLTAKASAYWTEREGHLPGHPVPPPADLDFSTGALLPGRFVNNAFAGWDGRAGMEWPELGLAADMTAEPIHDIAMVYMPTHRPDFFCFEPMTHLPNGHHMPRFGGLRVLAPGESMTGEVTISIRRIQHGR